MYPSLTDLAISISRYAKPAISSAVFLLPSSFACSMLELVTARNPSTTRSMNEARDTNSTADWDLRKNFLIFAWLILNCRNVKDKFPPVDYLGCHYVVRNIQLDHSFRALARVEYRLRRVNYVSAYFGCLRIRYFLARFLGIIIKKISRGHHNRKSQCHN